MRDQMPPLGRDMSAARAAEADNPYRPYVAHAPAARGHHRRHGFAIFHDGNAGHFWRGEVASLVGETLLITGVVLWITYLIYSPIAIAAVVAAQALPWLLAGPLAVPLENVAEPAVWLRRFGIARVLCALGLVVIQLLHYRGILSGVEYPIVFLLIFVNALCGRLRAGLRVAATRTCLAPGEPELVADDLQIGASIVAVVGPLLAALLFVLLGGRVLLVAIGAAVAYFLSGNSEGFLEPLPLARRAFARATPETAVEDENLRTELHDAAQPDEKRPGVAFADAGANDTRQVEERALPEWYQQGPRSISEGIAELRAGLGLASIANSSRTSLYILGSLALIGGGMAVLEVFYVVYVLQQAGFYLGPLLAAEACGLVLGNFVARGFLAKDSWRAAIGLGLVSMGLALVLLGLFPRVLVALGAVLLLGWGSALAVWGARRGLRVGYDGPERRALTAAEGFVSALCGLAGAAIFVFFYVYLSPTYFSLQPLVANPLLQRFNLSAAYSAWGLNELFLVTGLLLVLLSAAFSISLAAGGTGPRAARLAVPGAPLAQGLIGGLAGADDWSDDEDADDDAYASRYAPRAASTRGRGYGRSAGGGFARYGAVGYRRGETDYESAAMSAYGSAYGDDPYGEDDEDDDEDDGW